MKFLVSQVPQEYLNDGDEYFFAPGSTNAYYYQVDYEEDDQVTISDTCGRSMPIGMDELNALVEVLDRINTYHTELASVKTEMLRELTYGSAE